MSVVQSGYHVLSKTTQNYIYIVDFGLLFRNVQSGSREWHSNYCRIMVMSAVWLEGLRETCSEAVAHWTTR